MALYVTSTDIFSVDPPVFVSMAVKVAEGSLEHTTRLVAEGATPTLGSWVTGTVVVAVPVRGQPVPAVASTWTVKPAVGHSAPAVLLQITVTVPSLPDTVDGGRREGDGWMEGGSGQQAKNTTKKRQTAERNRSSQ